MPGAPSVYWARNSFVQCSIEKFHKLKKYTLLFVQSGDFGMADIAEVISNLSIATSSETTNVSLFSRDIQTSTVVIGRILDHIEDEVASSQPGDLLPFRKVSVT